ncbi:uncharacterized protein EI97DRAFT_447246 [Westerdykella ornata]|uniref:Pal1-domain-containing protein n=1 Tax=Westerdykella ornata TaxID=318751 RepID=A0A6A6JZJ3_WESOR|nr:uncharacterized protein EI97DRAFT_447246 [Westerdykella ornata]KAF2281196.1 hypothetical protein EI97DRAFT_447246 [Westerdykella ornata]
MPDKDVMAAQHALIDPLIEPDPSDETGLNSHFTSTFAPRESPVGGAPITPPHQKSDTSRETNPFRNAASSRSGSLATSSSYKSPSHANHAERFPAVTGYPSPPGSASPRRDNFGNYADNYAPSYPGRSRRSTEGSSQPQERTISGVSRSSSLRERYPGDESNRPLDMLRKENKAAYRAHHLRKKNFQGADVIDRLDSTAQYHHEGPYDAASRARNVDPGHSPLAAVQKSNEEALRATPRENIIDAVTKHRPLEGTANIPPGMPDRFGRVLDYEEGADLMREPGADYRRWPGIEYKPDDLKGKGEPSFSEDKSRKEHKKFGDSGVEMKTPRRRGHSLGKLNEPESRELMNPFEDSHAQGDSSIKSVGSAIKRGLGSLRRKKEDH